MPDGEVSTTADGGTADADAVRDVVIRRDDIPEDGVVLQCGVVLDGHGGVVGRLHEDERYSAGGSTQ